jgi:hypothetical protein
MSELITPTSRTPAAELEEARACIHAALEALGSVATLAELLPAAIAHDTLVALSDETPDEPVSQATGAAMSSPAYHAAEMIFEAIDLARVRLTMVG